MYIYGLEDKGKLDETGELSGICHFCGNIYTSDKFLPSKQTVNNYIPCKYCVMLGEYSKDE